jgi:hypothetical protein
VASPLLLLHDVDHSAVRIEDEEAARAPRLVAEWIHDLVASLDGFRVNDVDVLDLDGDVGPDRRRRVELITASCAVSFDDEAKPTIQSRSIASSSPITAS